MKRISGRKFWCAAGAVNWEPRPNNGWSADVANLGHLSVQRNNGGFTGYLDETPILHQTTPATAMSDLGVWAMREMEKRIA